MSLEIIVNWICEYAVKYNLLEVLKYLKEAFPEIMPNKIMFPNKDYMMALLVINQLISTRETEMNTCSDTALRKTEFWRRLRSLLLNIMTATNSTHNLPNFGSFIAKINVLEYVIYSRNRDSIELDCKIEEMLNESCAVRYERETNEESECLKKLSVIQIREDFDSDIDMKIKKLLSDSCIDNLKQLIENKVLSSAAVRLEQFANCSEDFDCTHPFMAQLRFSVDNILSRMEINDSFSASDLKEIILALKVEYEIQNIPAPPIVVYIKDNETKGIFGIKIKQ